MIVIPVYNMLLLPDTNIYLQTEHFRKLAGRAVVGERVVLLPQRRDEVREALTEESFYPIGVTGVVREIGKEGFVVIRTKSRANIDMVHVGADHTIELTISKRPDQNPLSAAESAAKCTRMQEAVRKHVEGFHWGNAYAGLIDGMTSVDEIASALGVWMSLSAEDRYALLAEDDISRRTEKLEEAVYEFLEVAKVQMNAADEQKREYQDMYRESAIRKQMDVLQKELDELHPEKVSDLQGFARKIADSDMNEAARNEADKVLNRLKQEGSHSPESGMLYDYLDFVTSLAWRAPEPEYIDLSDAERILEEDHYGLKKVKKRIIQQIAVMNLKRSQSGSILLFVGAPGTGKTSIGKSIARALGREYVRVSLGGVRDEADIRGHRRTYIGAMPGRIMDGIQKSGVSNPVMVLDEIDKLSASYNGDPASALLEVLDPEQNNTFTDHYMNVPYDLSKVLFICTANTVDTIPEPLLNRMEVIPFEGYTPTEKLQIAKAHLLPKAMEAMGIEEGQLSVSDEVLAAIIADYTREAGVRGLRKRMDALCRGAAVQISAVSRGQSGTDASDAPAADKTAPDFPQSAGLPVMIETEQLREEFDMRPVRHEHTPDEQKPGVVTGLAWTSAGGEILYIETLFTRGRGNLIITGKLGEVMKESAQIAVSLVKSMFPDKARMFRENDLHIHVPEGAVPKDGPSAGVTMTTAIASLVTGKPVDPHIGMTGEVSLRGVVSPIGGLPEKLLAAQRAGVTRVLIPQENVDDLRDVPQEVKDVIEIIPVSEITDVLTLTGIAESGCDKKVG